MRRDIIHILRSQTIQACQPRLRVDMPSIRTVPCHPMRPSEPPQPQPNSALCHCQAILGLSRSSRASPATLQPSSTNRTASIRFPSWIRQQQRVHCRFFGFHAAYYVPRSFPFHVLCHASSTWSLFHVQPCEKIISSKVLQLLHRNLAALYRSSPSTTSTPRLLPLVLTWTLLTVLEALTSALPALTTPILRRKATWLRSVLRPSATGSP